MNTLSRVTLGMALPAILCISLNPAVALPNGKPFIEIEGQIIEVQADVSTLESKYEDIRTRLNNLDLDLQGQIDALNGEIAALKAVDASMQSSLSATIQTLAEQGTAIEDLLKALDDVVSELMLVKDSTVANSDAVAALEESQQDILASLAGLEPGLLAAMNDIAENQTLIKKLENDVASLEENKQNDIVGQCPENASVQEVMDDGSLVCGTPDVNGAVTSYLVIGKPGSLANSYEEETYCAVYDPVFGYCLVMDTREIWHFTFNGSIAQCPPETIAGGGGYRILDANFGRDIEVNSSEPLHPDNEFAQKYAVVNGIEIGEGWMATAKNFSQYLSPKQSIIAFAVCLAQ